MFTFISPGVHPAAIGANATGPAQDFDGQETACFAIQQIGDLEESGTLDGKIQHSDDNVSWSNVSGATFAQVDAAHNLQVIYFTRTKRYLRWAASVSGSGVLFTVSASIGIYTPINNSLQPQPSNMRTQLSAKPKSIACYNSASRTTTPDPMATQNSFEARGLEVVFDITAVPGSAPSLVLTIQGFDPTTGKFHTLLASAAKTAIGTTVLRVYPGLTPASNLVASDVLPPLWRVIVEAGNGNAATYAVGANLLY